MVWRCAQMLALIGLSACSVFPEASFTLASDSRPPQWCSGSVVEMSYYTGPLGRTAKFTCTDTAGREITVRGTLRGLKPMHLKNSPPGFPPGYPSYEVISFAGKSEVIEHRKMEPVFYVSDDEGIRTELGVTAN